MVPADAAPQERDLAPDPNAGASITMGQLGQELNSLLDGSLRSVGLALRQLNDPPGGESVIAKLLTALAAMWHILIAPYAEDHRAAVVVQMAPEAEEAPIGPLAVAAGRQPVTVPRRSLGDS